MTEGVPMTLHAASASTAQAPRYHALVPCAGVGARAGTAGPKQYAPLRGSPLVAHTLESLLRVPRLASVVVVLAPDDGGAFERAVPPGVRARCQVVRCGGATRAASVANGLAALQAMGAGAQDWVLVHDAARCLVQPAWVDRLIDACATDDVGGLLALPLADTLKAEGRDGRAAATVDRRGKWAAQTPQMFRLETLAKALAHAGPGVTDEASAIEALGVEPLLVRGDWENFKVTWPDDFALAERLLASRPAG